MAEIKLPDIRPAKTIEEKVDALYDAYFVMRKFMTYYLSGNLDEENVVRAQEAVIANVLAGTIKADQIDVTEGKIQAAQIEDLVVGGNVTMGPNARISWSQVTNKPSIPVLPSYIKSTYIDSTTVQSPTIIGGQIIGGSITSNSTINVTTNAYIGRRLYMQTSTYTDGIYFATFDPNSKITVDTGGAIIFGTYAEAPLFISTKGANGSFRSADGKTISVEGGVITRIA